MHREPAWMAPEDRGARSGARRAHPALLLLVLGLAPAVVRASPLSLDDAVRLAEARAAGLTRGEAARARAALAVFRAELARVRARVDLEISEMYNRSNIFGPPPGAMEIDLGLSNVTADLGVPLFTGFRISAEIDRTEALERASQHDLASLHRQLRVDVARAYWAVRRLGLMLDAHRRATSRFDEQEKLVEVRVRSGLAPELDNVRARSTRAELELELAGYQATRAESEAELAALLGLPDPSPSDEVRDIREVPTLEAILERARANRPEIAAARERADAEGQALRVARAGYYPEIELFALLQYGNNPLLAGADVREVSFGASPFKNLVGDVQAGVRLRLNIFDTLGTWYAVQDAAHGERIAVAELESVRQTVETEVRGAHARTTSLMARRSWIDRAIEAKREAVEILARSYDTGSAPLSDFLEAAIELSRAEVQLADVSGALTLAGIELEATSGKR